MRSLLALCLFLSLAWAQVRLLSPPSLAGIPGEYLTLSLEVEGQGPLVLRLFPPEGWQALSQERKAGLEGGRETVSFTLRVPFLPAGTQSKAEVVAYLGEKEAARAEVALSVLPLVQIALSAPATLEAQLGGPFEFPAYVQNRSNQRAKVLLEAEAAMFQVFLNPQGLELAPGETGVVRVLVNPQGEISAGYRFYLKLRATPEGKAEARKEAGVIVLFQETLGAKTQGKDPSLTLNLGLGLSLGANLERGQLTGQVGYLLAPSLTGALSDYVNLTATPSPLTESLSDPWPSPQTLALSLKGEGWEARAQGGGGGLSAGGTFRLGDARLGLEGSYRPQALSLRASAASLDSNLDLQGSLSTQLTPAGRQDNLNLRYRLPLESGLTLGLGTDLAGQTQGAYGLSLGLSQNLTWQTQELDLVQSYAGVPLAGLHVLGLTGGTRSLYPLGLRGSTSLQLGSLPALWQNQASLYYQPWSGTFLSLTLSYRQQGEDRGLGLNPGLATAFGEPGVYAGSLSLGYGLQRALSGQAPESQSYQGSLSLGTKDLSFSGFLRYLHQAQPYLEGNLLLRLVLPAGSLEGSYLVKQGNDQPLTLYGAAWNQLWPGSLQSRLFYEYRQEASPSQRLGLGLYRRNFLEPGLSLGASYTLILQAGEARHAFGLTLYYAQALSFATPREVVDLFGGRKGGEVMGQAFLDPNLNGRLDPGESPLADLKVCLGQVCEATDAQGRYRLVAASGAGTLRFLGLPATLALVGEAGVDVPLNARLEKNLPFAPATTLAVRVLDGEKGSGLAYAGVCAEGPVGRCTRADVNGNALLGGLFPGTYRLYPDPRYLPEGYRAEKEAQVRVELKPLEAPPLVVLPPKREVVVTYTAERLSLVATADPPTALAGAEVEVKALVQGQPERLWLDLPSGPVSLQPQEDNYYAIRIRLHLPPGLHALRVRASAQGQEAEAPLWLQVVPGALFEPQVVNSPKVHLTLRFRATQVTLQAEGQAFPLQSQDGYTWTGEVPLGPGQHTLLVFADGEALGPVRLDLPSESATQ